jgi:hypothetical protein
MEKSFEDLLTGLDDDLEPDIDDIFTNYDHLPEVCHLITQGPVIGYLHRGQLLAIYTGASYWLFT